MASIQTLARFSVEEILPLLGLEKPRRAFETTYGTFLAKVGTPRLECLRRNQSCVSCNKTGTIFLLQRHFQQLHRVGVNCFRDPCPWCSLRRDSNKPKLADAPHLNLYYQGPNGHLILMTQDHIIPRSRGGSSKIHNLQTMCFLCNNRKSNNLPTGEWDYPKSNHAEQNSTIAMVAGSLVP